MRIRTGIGIDVHRLAEGRELWLGGIRIEHDKGLEGHSDADVVIHALCDALLGSLALGDIGQHFPDNDMQYKNIDSKILLEKIVLLLYTRGWRMVNADITVCAQKPKLLPYIPQMRKTLSEVMKTAIDNISIKATTTEKLGFEGREEGISAWATVLVTDDI